MNRADAYGMAVYLIGIIAFAAAGVIVLFTYVIHTGYGWKAVIVLGLAALTTLIGEIIYATDSEARAGEETSKERHA